MGLYWLLYPPVCNVVAMAIKADMKGILCFSHILLSALLPLDQVDQILGLASGCSSYMEDLSSGCTTDGGTRMDVVLGETALATA